ncbi:MAG: hypothetical protein KF708_08380 [Pirellulales bacterium]|nr:hypothetical protein [Pirellulales bacterium]
MDYDVQRCTRHCAQSGRELTEGETFYSVLVAEGSHVRRYDYSAEAWQGPVGDRIVGWWKSQMPTRQAKRARMAPGDVLLEYFKQLAEQPGQDDLRYVLALLLVRHRVLRQEGIESSKHGAEMLLLYCPRHEETYRLAVAPPEDERIGPIQEHLAQLLDAPAS